MSTLAQQPQLCARVVMNPYNSAPATGQQP